MSSGRSTPWQAAHTIECSVSHSQNDICVGKLLKAVPTGAATPGTDHIVPTTQTRSSMSDPADRSSNQGTALRTLPDITLPNSTLVEVTVLHQRRLQ